jgi:hypothetical protein
MVMTIAAATGISDSREANEPSAMGAGGQPTPFFAGHRFKSLPSGSLSRRSLGLKILRHAELKALIVLRLKVQTALQRRALCLPGVESCRGPLDRVRSNA